MDQTCCVLCKDVLMFPLSGISTLTAAALGNIVGDVSGIWLGGTVEFFVGKVRGFFLAKDTSFSVFFETPISV